MLRARLETRSGDPDHADVYEAAQKWRADWRWLGCADDTKHLMRVS